jgi:PPOX class probable F420-dependent enzyme
MSTPLSETAREILASPVIAHVAVVDDRGRPHVSPIWVDVADDGRLILNTAVGRVKDRYLAEGSPVAVSAADPADGYRWTMVRGTVAERRTDGADADIDALAKKYLGVDSYPFRQEGEQRVTVVVDADQVVPPA